jgi:sulfur carrier protein ThiS
VVTLNFKLSDVGSMQLESTVPVKFEKILNQCIARTASECGEVLAIRNGKVLTSQDIVAESDVIDVYPAISGG